MNNDEKNNDRPYVICHMLTSLDGKIDGSFMSAPENISAIEEYARIRELYVCKATLYGTVTMQGSYSEGLVGQLPVSSVILPRDDYIAQTDVQNYIVSVDPKGVLGWKLKYIEKKNRPKAHIIEVLSQQVSNDYLHYLRTVGISYIFAGRDLIDCGMMIRKLKELFQIDRLMIAGGGLMNWSFLQDGLIDELSLVISPLADGSRTAVSIFEKADFLSDKGPAVFLIKEVQKLQGDSIWLRYQLKRM